MSIPFRDEARSQTRLSGTTFLYRARYLKSVSRMMRPESRYLHWRKGLRQTDETNVCLIRNRRWINYYLKECEESGCMNIFHRYTNWRQILHQLNVTVIHVRVVLICKLVSEVRFNRDDFPETEVLKYGYKNWKAM